MKGNSIGLQNRPNALALLAALIAWTLVSGASARAQTIAEAIDATNLIWTTGGDVPWFAQSTNTHDSIDAIRNGTLGSNQTSWIETTVVGPATVSYWKVSAFGAGHVNRRFTVNGIWPGGSLAEFSSSLWTERTYDLGAGTNILRWLVSDYYGTGSTEYDVLDEFSVGPPRPLALMYQPYDQTVFSGASASFYALAAGTPPLQYQWRKDGNNIADATNEFLSLNAVSTNAAGNYSLVASNSQGFVVSSTALLTVLPPSPPFFIYEPESLAAYTGQGFYLSGYVDGSPPFVYQWRKDGTNLPGANWSSLFLANLSLADAGSYTLAVSNSLGGVESSNAVLTVILSVAPVITRHPRSLEVAAGVNTWMSVLADGAPSSCYSWTRADIAPEPPPDPPLPVPCQDQYRWFSYATTNDVGVYFATAINSGGVTVSRDALLTVLPPLSLKSSWGQGAEGVFVTNGLAFLACGTNGLTILNVSNPASPQLLGGYDTPGYASAVRVSGNLAFVADGSTGLQILSVTNPSSPVLIGGYATPGYANDVAVRSNLAYVACGKLLILNVSNPALPSLVGSFSTNVSARNVVLSGKSAFISSPYSEILPGTNVAGLLAIDISDPAHPVGVGRLSLGIGNMDVREQIVFGVTGNSLKVITVTNPAQPAVIGKFDSYYSTNFLPHVGISATDVRVVNNRAYVSASPGSDARLYVLDVRDPTEPIPVGYFTAPGHANALWVDGHYVYLAGNDSPLLTIETPFDPQSEGPPALLLTVQNGMALQIHGRRGLHYDLEYADSLTGFPWQSFQTILLTNENAVIEVPSQSNRRFFRLRQLD